MIQTAQRIPAVRILKLLEGRENPLRQLSKEIPFVPLQELIVLPSSVLHPRETDDAVQVRLIGAGHV
jgi:hypothetical protein